MKGHPSPPSPSPSNPACLLLLLLPSTTPAYGLLRILLCQTILSSFLLFHRGPLLTLFLPAIYHKVLKSFIIIQRTPSLSLSPSLLLLLLYSLHLPCPYCLPPAFPVFPNNLNMITKTELWLAVSPLAHLPSILPFAPASLFLFFHLLPFPPLPFSLHIQKPSLCRPDVSTMADASSLLSFSPPPSSLPFFPLRLQGRIEDEGKWLRKEDAYR